MLYSSKRLRERRLENLTKSPKYVLTLCYGMHSVWKRKICID